MAALPEGIDKREGSLIHMAMAPVCLRLAEGYAALRAYYDLMFTDTAAGIYLDRLAEQYGIFRRPASAAVREAVFTGPEGEPAFIPAGSRFYIDGPCMTTGKNVVLTRWTFVSKVMPSLFNMLSRFVIAFLPRSKSLFCSPLFLFFD